jgi:diacylglycerol kinase (ATP)
VPANHQLKILFVINPIAGGLKKTEWEQIAATHLKEAGHSFEMYHTTGNNDKVSIEHYIQTLQPDRVVAVGGDGTLKLVAEVLAGKHIPIGIIPAGSANGMAKELGIPTGLTECMEVILHGEVRKIDAIRVNTTDLCLHLSDIGMNAQLVKYFEERGIRGMLGYARGIVKMFLKRHILHVTINDGKNKLVRESVMVVLANARLYGTGAMINPDGDISDGFFEVVIVKRMAPITLLKMFLKRKSFKDEQLEIIQVQSVDIEVKRAAYFQIDGEYKGRMKKVRARIEKHALTMVLPPKSALE